MVLNWRSTFQTCPLLQQAGGRRGSRRDSVLAGAGVGNSFSSLIFPCWLLQRGFLSNVFKRSLRGITGSGSCLALLVRRIIGRGPSQEWIYIKLYNQTARRRIPAQPWAGRIGFNPASLGKVPMRFFFFEPWAVPLWTCPSFFSLFLPGRPTQN
jgi:hypothetical protein